MITYIIKYQTYTGEVKTVEKTGYDRHHVINQLVNCKEVIDIDVKKINTHIPHVHSFRSLYLDPNEEMEIMRHWNQIQINPFL